MRLVDISTYIPSPRELRPASPAHAAYAGSEWKTELVTIMHPDRPGSLGRTSRKIMAPLHAGTHIDAPEHYFRGGKRIDEFPLETFYGEALVVDMRHKSPGGAITPKDLEDAAGNKIKQGDILIIRTDWMKKSESEDYYPGSPYMEAAAAEWCVKKKIKLLGKDYVRKYQAPIPEPPVDVLMRNGILVIDNLANLDQVRKERVRVVAFPIKVKAEAAITRAVIIED